MFNVDYATFLEKFGKPIVAMEYNGGSIYRFEKDGPWFYFYGMHSCRPDGSDTFLEPEPYAICTAMYAYVKEWLKTTVPITSIDDIKALGPISSYDYGYNEYESVYNYHGETGWYYVWIEEATGENAVFLKLKD